MPGSSFQSVAESVIEVFNTEFATEHYVMIPDRLHESLGQKRVDVGIAPLEDYPQARDALVQETWVEVRFYGIWKKEISPNTQVNPFAVTEVAERFKDALRRANSDPHTSRVWFFDVRRTQYPPDP